MTSTLEQTTDERPRRSRKRAPRELPPLAYSVVDAAAACRVSRSQLYAEIRAGRLVARKRGAATLILEHDLQNWLRNLPQK